MKRALPTGPIWEQMKAEKNWAAAGIGETKVPVNAKSGIPTNRESAAFMTFEDAAKAVNALMKRVGEVNAEIDRINAKRPPEKRFQHHMTFEVAYLPRDGSAGVVGDFDKVRDPESGEITADWLRPVIDAPETYTEVSVSGTGLHILTARQPEDHGTRERNGAGLYASNARFIVLTFRHLTGTPTLINGALRAREVIESRAGKAEVRNRAARKRLGLALPEDHHDPAMIPTILRSLPNPHQDYDEWVKMAHAAWACAQDVDAKTALEIEQAFYDWSAKLEGNHTDSAERLWGSIKGVREIGPGSFYFMARQLGWTPSGRKPPPMRVTMHKWIDRAFDGDAEAMQRIARFMLTSYREDVAFVMVTAMASFTRMDVEQMLAHETARADEIAAADMEEMQNGRL